MNPLWLIPSALAGAFVALVGIGWWFVEMIDSGQLVVVHPRERAPQRSAPTPRPPPSPNVIDINSRRGK